MRIPCLFATVILALALNSAAGAAETKKRELLPIPENLVVLSFDDCNLSDRTLVAGVLKEHGFGATFYVTEGLGFLKNKKHYTTWAQIRELHEMGYEIGNHTQHHRNVARLSRERLAASLNHINQRCAEYKIPKPVTFCYPGFQHNLRAVEVVDELGFQFARRGVGPEYPDGGKGARGPAYDPQTDHPLLVPTTGYAGPDWGMDDLKWAVQQATGGKIAILCYHGVPAKEHSWVSVAPADFREQMEYLKQQGCTVIAMRDLAEYVDTSRQPKDPYAPLKKRQQKPQEPGAAAVPNAPKL